MLRLLFCLLIVTSPALADDVQYRNSRFGTRAVLPIKFQKIQTPSNGDGQIFQMTGSSGLVSIYGANNPWKGGWGGYRRGLIEGFKREGLIVSYQSGQRNWLVLSGRMKGNMIYLRAIGCDKGPMHHIYFNYPEQEKSKWKWIIEKYAKTIGGPCR